MNTDWTGIYICKECYKTGSRWNHIITDHKEGEQLEDQRNVGENSCNSGDGTDQTAPILDVYDDDDDSSLIIKYNSSCAYQWQTLKVIGLSTESCQKKL